MNMVLAPNHTSIIYPNGHKLIKPPAKSEFVEFMSYPGEVIKVIAKHKYRDSIMYIR
jgi:hypothetical protein